MTIGGVPEYPPQLINHGLVSSGVDIIENTYGDNCESFVSQTDFRELKMALNCE